MKYGPDSTWFKCVTHQFPRLSCASTLWSTAAAAEAIWANRAPGSKDGIGDDDDSDDDDSDDDDSDDDDSDDNDEK